MCACFLIRGYSEPCKRKLLLVQALERQQHVSDALQEPSYFQPQTPEIKNFQANTSSLSNAALVGSPETSAQKVHEQGKADQPTIKYSRKAVPSTKQLQQAANAQYVQAMKEYFAEVLPCQ